MKALLVFFCLFSISLYAGSVTLVNDTKYELEASVEGRDGTEFTPIILKKGEKKTWSDTFGQSGFTGKHSMESAQGNRSKTPYMVTWRFSKDKEFYSRCRDVATGSTVTANGCKGSE